MVFFSRKKRDIEMSYYRNHNAIQCNVAYRFTILSISKCRYVDLCK